MRRWVDPRVWPVLVLGAMLGPACMRYYDVDAEIVNESNRTVRVEFKAKADDRVRERLSAQLAPGGRFQRVLTGHSDVRAEATLEGGDCPNGPILVRFENPGFICTIRNEAAGIRVEWKARPAPAAPETPTCAPRSS